MSRQSTVLSRLVGVGPRLDMIVLDRGFQEGGYQMDPCSWCKRDAVRVRGFVDVAG